VSFISGEPIRAASQEQAKGRRATAEPKRWRKFYSAQPALVNRSAGGFVDRGVGGLGHSRTSLPHVRKSTGNREDRDQPDSWPAGQRCWAYSRQTAGDR